MKRYYGYKKKKFKINGRLVTVIISFVMCVVLTIFYGNHLKKRVLESQTLLPETTQTSDTQQQPEDTSKTHDTRSVNAVLLPQEWSGSIDAMKSAVASISATQHDAATVVLRRNDGYPLYASDITASVAKPETSLAPVSLTALVSELHKANMYISGYFTSNITGSGEYTAEFIKNYEIALIGELYTAGIDEILIDGLSPDSTSLSWITDLYKEIKNCYPDLVVGIVVPAKVVSYDTPSLLFHTLASAADFIALDMSEAETESYQKLIDDSTLYFSKYNLRALISAADTDQLTQRLTILNDSAIYNRQIIMQRS